MVLSSAAVDQVTRTTTGAGTPEHLVWTPVRIGPVTVKNRLVMASTTSALGQDGFVTDRNCAYYARRARGGVGMVVTEALHVHPTSNIGYNNLAVHADAHVPGLARLAAAIKDGGAHAIAQIIHVGRQWNSVVSRRATWSPSLLPSFPVFLEHPHEMTVEEIAEVVAAFGAAARRAREAGFDGVEVHAAHGFLIQHVEDVLALAPDAVVVATGTRPWLPEIPGAGAAHVWQMEWVITESPALGRTAVVLDCDHHAAPMAVAALLATRGMEVDLVNPLHLAGAEVEINTQTVCYSQLAQHGVRVHTNTVAVAIDGPRVVLENRFSGARSEIAGVDAVVICSPGRAADGLAGPLRARVKELVVVGDSYAPRRLLAGVRDAYTAARAL